MRQAPGGNHDPASDGDQPTAHRRLDREILKLGAMVVLGTIMTVVGLTIVNVAVPTLGTDLKASISTTQWVLTGSTLAVAGVIPLTGWATERFGAKCVWVVSLLGFMLGWALADAFRASFWVAVGLIAIALLPALLLPRPQRQDRPETATEGGPTNDR